MPVVSLISTLKLWHFGVGKWCIANQNSVLMPILLIYNNVHILNAAPFFDLKVLHIWHSSNMMLDKKGLLHISSKIILYTYILHRY